MAKGEIFGQLPTWAKGVIAVAIVGGVAFVGYKIYKGLVIIRDKKDFKAETDAVKTELNQLNSIPTSKQTISNAAALGMANALFAAMDGIGTDITAISKQLLQLKNQADWLAVNAAYGVRKLNSGIIGKSDFIGSLLASLTDEISTTDAPYTNQLNKFFKAKGINVVL